MQLASGTRYRYGATYMMREINIPRVENAPTITRIEISTVDNAPINGVVFTVKGVRADD